MQFFLPKDSRVMPGKRYPSLSHSVKLFHVYRFNPESKKNPQMDTYPVDASCAMVLNGLDYIKQYFDPLFSFRKSCYEGVCGSCAMNINGVNTLACITPLKALSGSTVIYPLPHMSVIKDLVVNIQDALKQYASIKPWLQAAPVSQDEERRQNPSQRANLDGLWECILCFCCTASCPSYWWNSQRYLGPAVLLQAQRFLADNRDENTQKRLDFLDETFRLYRCHTILNCAKACPKNLNPAQAIASIRRNILKKMIHEK
jgi:succinate dehydrogenase / fumarate reductase iron-sulfur subunit